MGGHNLGNCRVAWNLFTIFYKNTSLGVLVLSTVIPTANARLWEIQPTLTLRQTYSDNIGLAPSGEESSCTFTELNPGLSVRPREEGGRIDFNFNVRVQSPLVLGCDSARSSLFLQYQSDILAEIIKESFFVESQSSISQQNASATGRIGTDSRSDTGNIVQVRTFSISPFWTPHWGGYADGEMRLRFNTLSTSGGGASDTTGHSEIFRLQSGRKFSAFSWGLNFNNQEQNRSGNVPSVRFRQYSAQLGYRFNREFNAFIQTGNFDNQFQSNTSSNRNGSFFTVGGGWAPTPRFNVQAGAGNNSFITINYNPTRRTTLSATWNRNDVGTNTGDTFNLNFQHTTRRTVWNASYFEDTTTVQQVLLDQEIFVLRDQFGNIVQNPVAGQQLFIDTLTIPTLTNDVIERKRGQFSVAANTAHNTVSLSLFSEKRTFQISGLDQDVVGWTGQWNWQFGRKTSSNILVSWQKTDGTDVLGTGFNSRNNELTLFQFLLTRNLSRHLRAVGEYRFTTQESDFRNNEYAENRLVASLVYTF